MIDFERAGQRLEREFGKPIRDKLKIKAWEVGATGVVLQVDQPNREAASYIWLPYPSDGENVPEIALEYPAEAGRHSGTYPSKGLERGKPALKLIVRTQRELDQTMRFIKAMAAKQPLPSVEVEIPPTEAPTLVEDVLGAAVNQAARPRRETIARAVQREVWRRDEGKCVECSSKERLCFDHVIPWSRGGSNTARNLQLLCERCNLSKGNRI